MIVKWKSVAFLQYLNGAYRLSVFYMAIYVTVRAVHTERSIYARQARSLQNTKEVSDNRTTSNTDTLGKNPLSLYRTASNFASFNHAQTLCRERREMWVRSTQRSVHFLSSWPRQLPTLHSQFQSDFRSFSTSTCAKRHITALQGKALHFGASRNFSRSKVEHHF